MLKCDRIRMIMAPFERGATSTPSSFPTKDCSRHLLTDEAATMAAARHCRDAVMTAGMDPSPHFIWLVRPAGTAPRREGRTHHRIFGDGNHARGNNIDTAELLPPRQPSRPPLRRLEFLKQEGKKISRMDRCRTPRCPAHSALRFSWAESLSAKEAVA